MGCSSVAADAGLGADDCCIGSIMDSGVSCNDTMEAPCIIDLGERLWLVLFIALGWSISRNTLLLYNCAVYDALRSILPISVPCG